MIFDTPQYRAIVQDGLIVKKFEDALYPKLLFREEAMMEMWGDGQGDMKLFTGDGLLPVSTAPLQPRQDPTPKQYTREQWEARMRYLGDAIDTHVPTAVAAAVNFILRDVRKLGEQAGDALDRVCRNSLANAGESGWTVADGAAGPATTIRVKRLNGFTRARRPDLTTGSPVKYDPVSVNNPLPIRYGTGSSLANSATVVGFTPDFPGDEIGPGTITVAVAITVADRDLIASTARTARRISGGGFRVDDVGSADRLTLADIRNGVARMSTVDVPKHGDGYFHLHMDATGREQIFADNEFQRLHESLPDGLAYTEFAVKKILGTIVYENNRCPQPLNVGITNGQTDGSADNYNPARETFAGELYNNGDPASATAQVHRAIMTGAEGLREYQVDLDTYVTDVGLNGKLSEMPKVSAQGGEVNTRGVKLIQRAPQNRRQDEIGQMWAYEGDFVFRPDGATGDGAYFKRVFVILHGDAVT